jgi:hypothetical protein
MVLTTERPIHRARALRSPCYSYIILSSGPRRAPSRAHQASQLAPRPAVPMPNPRESAAGQVARPGRAATRDRESKADHLAPPDQRNVPAVAALGGSDPLDLPPSMRLSSLAPTVRLGLADASAHELAEPPARRRRAARVDAPPRAGELLQANLSMARHGTHTRLADGSQLWRLAVRCRRCKWLAVDLAGVHLQGDERLFVHGEGGVGARGAYTAAGMHAVRGTLSTPPLPGRLLTLECIASRTDAPPSIRIVRVLAGELRAFGAAAGAFDRSLASASERASAPLGRSARPRISLESRGPPHGQPRLPVLVRSPPQPSSLNPSLPRSPLQSSGCLGWLHGRRGVPVAMGACGAWRGGADDRGRHLLR